jgi:Holliday junction DNA helicase RuvA
MIARLEGRLLERTPTRVVIDVGGVGYEALIPLSTFGRLPDEGKTVALRIHTHVREDALMLFGFGSALELQLFERLIAVTGIGPRLALAVLSGIEPPELIRAVQQADIARLTAIPGVGKKTAERIALELKDRLAKLEPALQPGPPGAGSMRDDLLSALLNLGYHRPAAEKAIDAALGHAPAGVFEVVLRDALRRLSR